VFLTLIAFASTGLAIYTCRVVPWTDKGSRELDWCLLWSDKDNIQDDTTKEYLERLLYTSWSVSLLIIILSLFSTITMLTTCCRIVPDLLLKCTSIVMLVSAFLLFVLFILAFDSCHFSEDCHLGYGSIPIITAFGTWLLAGLLALCIRQIRNDESDDEKSDYEINEIPEAFVVDRIGDWED